MSIMKVMDKDNFVQENMARWADAVDKGWRPIVQEALERIGNLWEANGLALEDLAVLEVKEKFGTLRMYVSYFDATDGVDNGDDIAAVMADLEKCDYTARNAVTDNMPVSYNNKFI